MIALDSKKLKLYKSLFNGRKDVFALHWEKGNRSGYMPAWYFDPYIYRLYKIKGGTFKDFPDKSLRRLTDKELTKHLNGEQLIGLYPLLENNKSWFIAADFDKKNWEQDCRRMITVCEEYDLPVYLERSRSGKGGHI